jgi:putative DNA primase/helicase
VAPKQKGTPPPGLSAADWERIGTWMPEIADKKLGHLQREANGTFRAGEKRNLVIYPGGGFHDFVAGKSGRGAVQLIAHLNKIQESAAVTVALTWLKGQTGTGSLSTSVAHDEEAEAIAEDDEIRSAILAAEWNAAEPIDGSAAEVYLKSRGLDPSPDDRKVLRQITHKLTGSTIMVAAITAENRDIVALQETYLTATGKKADVLAVRRTMRGPHDWNTRGLVRFGNPRAKKVHLCEGVEDALSVRAAGAECVFALTGLSRLARIALSSHVEEIVIVRDDDGDGTPADDMLWRGIVGLLGNTDSRVNVSLTPKPAFAATDLAIKLKDVNDLLQHDAKAVKELLASATSQPRGLSDGSIDVILDAMSRLDAIRWQRARERIAKLLGWKQVAALDKERAKRIATQAATDQMDGGEVYPVVVPWEEPVTDLGAVLDELVEELGRYMSASLLFLNTTALWSVLAHLLQRDDLGINISPRLAIQSPDKRCGKTTLLEAISCVVPKPDMLTSLTPAALFRTADEFRPTFLIDEADILMRKDAAGDLLMILNTGYRRKGANVVRMEKRADGGYNRVRFRTFTGMAFAGIKKLPDTLQDRSIVVSLQRASAGELKAHLTDGDSAVLNDICRKLTRWRADLADLPKIDRPLALANRLGDNWYPMRQIAALAGGEWPARAMAAALGDADTDVSDGQSALESLLDAIWRVFHATKKVRIHTRDLVGELLAMDEGKWKEAYRGGDISEYYIRSHLKGVIPPSAEARAERRWRENGPPYWGYHVLHLEDAWKHYLNGRGLPVEIKDTHAQASSKTGTSDTSDTEAGNVDISNGSPVSDGVSDTSRPSDTTPPDTAPSDGAASNTVSDTSVSDDQNLSDTASDTPFCKEDQTVNGSVSDVSDEDSVLDVGRAHHGFPRGARGRRHRQVGDGEARQ